MPLPPLPEPDRLSERLAGLAKAVPISLFLFSTLLGFNLAQIASLVLRPFSVSAFRAFNRWGADTWWGWCVILSQRALGIRIEVTGDALPERENAVVFANHQQMGDVVYLMMIARRCHRLGDLKWMAKASVKYVPGIGWGLAFLDCLFVKRDWARDRASIEATFSKLTRQAVPLWLVSFPEGTRSTPDKLEKSRAYAQREGLPPLDHLLVPRTKGFVASVRGLGGHVAAVYDVTIGYVRGVPTLWQYIKGYAKVTHLHVRRFPVAELPADDDGLARWLLDRFEEKDRLLAGFYRDGVVPPASSPRAHAEPVPQPT